MTIQPTPQPRAPEISQELLEDILSAGPWTPAKDYTTLERQLARLVQSKQDEIDKLRIRAEQAESELERWKKCAVCSKPIKPRAYCLNCTYTEFEKIQTEIERLTK